MKGLEPLKGISVSDSRVEADCNCLLQIFALSTLLVFKIPFFLSVLIPNAPFVRDFTNDQNFFVLSFFSRTAGIRTFRLKREDVVNKLNMFQICISNDLLNMCSEPFVMVLNVRAA